MDNNQIKTEINETKLRIAHVYNLYCKSIIKSHKLNIKVQLLCLAVTLGVPISSFYSTYSLSSLMMMLLAVIPAYSLYKSSDRINEILKPLTSEEMNLRQLKNFIKSEEFEEYVELARGIISNNKEEKNVTNKR